MWKYEERDKRVYWALWAADVQYFATVVVKIAGRKHTLALACVEWPSGAPLGNNAPKHPWGLRLYHKTNYNKDEGPEFVPVSLIESPLMFAPYTDVYRSGPHTEFRVAIPMDPF